jgi:hypothetical protein
MALSRGGLALLRPSPAGASVTGASGDRSPRRANGQTRRDRHDRHDRDDGLDAATGAARMPVEIRMARLGREFVHEIRIGRGRLSFRFGLVAYVDGHGLMKVGPSIQRGVEFVPEGS